MSRHSVRLLVAALLTGVTVAACDRSESATPPSDTALTAAALDIPAAPQPRDFAGSEACASCHAEQSTAWRASTHGQAGGTPGSRTNNVRVIAPFNGAPLRFADATVLPQRHGDRYEFVVQRDGEREIGRAHV